MATSQRRIHQTIDALRHALAVAELLAATEPEAARAVLAQAIKLAGKNIRTRP